MVFDCRFGPLGETAETLADGQAEFVPMIGTA
jgi:hypothetical protein